MKTKKNILAMMFLATVSTFTFTSCKSDDVEITDEALLTTSEDEAQMAKTSDEITSETDDYLTNVENSGYSGYSAVKGQEAKQVSNFPTVTIDKKDTITFPKVITIDFGTSGYVNQRGDTLKGKLTITVTGKMYKANSTRSIQFDAFSVNGNSVTGTKSVTYKGLNTSKNPYWTISANLGFKHRDGKSSTWKTERTRERTSAGIFPFFPWDDTYAIKGSSSGENAKGNKYSIVIDDSKPLILKETYPFFVQGSATTKVGEKVAVIDFGDGTKDNKATITINGVTKEITLKR